MTNQLDNVLAYGEIRLPEKRHVCDWCGRKRVQSVMCHDGNHDSYRKTWRCDKSKATGYKCERLTKDYNRVTGRYEVVKNKKPEMPGLVDVSKK